MREPVPLAGTARGGIRSARVAALPLAAAGVRRSCQASSMTDSLNLSAGERAEMLRAFSGLVTARIAGDNEAAASQLRSIVADQTHAALGNPAVAVARLAKQLEASAVVAAGITKMLAKRFDMSVDEAQQVIAQTWSSPDVEGWLP